MKQPKQKFPMKGAMALLPVEVTTCLDTFKKVEDMLDELHEALEECATISVSGKYVVELDFEKLSHTAAHFQEFHAQFLKAHEHRVTKQI